MNKNKTLGIVLLVVLVVAAIGYIFWPISAPVPRPTKRRPSTTAPSISTTGTPTRTETTVISKQYSLLTSAATSTTGIGIAEESPYEFHQYSKETGYRGIGERDLFALLIPPPPPPPPPREQLANCTRNWILWEIIDENECVIQDTRTQSHNLRVGEKLECAQINKIVPSENRVELVKPDNPNDTRWLQLQPIDVTTQGWKLKGTVPSLKTAFIVTGDNRQNKVKQGDVLQHVKVHDVLQNKVILTSGTMSKELSM